MPNGGVPMHMLLHPKSGDLVLHCLRGEVRVYEKAEWEAKTLEAEPVAALTPEESGALAWQLKYWLDSTLFQPGWHREDEVDATYSW